MRISAKVDYAVRAAVELAAAGGEPIKGEALAEAQDIPLKFLENILGELKHAGIVASQRGTEGGYWLAKPADEITLADIIRAVEGPLASVRGEGPEHSSTRARRSRCRRSGSRVRANLRAVLETRHARRRRRRRAAGRRSELSEPAEAWSRALAVVLGERAPVAARRLAQLMATGL